MSSFPSEGFDLMHGGGVSAKDDWSEMSRNRRLDWESAPEVEPGGLLRVLIDPPPDPSWLAAFEEVERSGFPSENRNQKYEQVVVRDGELVATGVDADHFVSTADFLDEWIARTNRAEVRREQEIARAVAVRDQRADRAAADARRATELLRQRQTR
jgi:hypothetical protein